MKKMNNKAQLAIQEKYTFALIVLIIYTFTIFLIPFVLEIFGYNFDKFSGTEVCNLFEFILPILTIVFGIVLTVFGVIQCRKKKK